MTKIKISDVLRKDLILIAYLVASGLLGYVLATYVAGNAMLTAIFAPAINYILYRIVKELEKEGYQEALK